MASNRQGVRLSVEHKPVERQLVLLVIGKQKVQVFQRFGQKETLHLVRVADGHPLDVVDRRVAMLDASVLLDGLEGVPAPILVLFIAGYSVEMK